VAAAATDPPAEAEDEEDAGPIQQMDSNRTTTNNVDAVEGITIQIHRSVLQ